MTRLPPCTGALCWPAWPPDDPPDAQPARTTRAPIEISAFFSENRCVTEGPPRVPTAGNGRCNGKPRRSPGRCCLQRCAPDSPPHSAGHTFVPPNLARIRRVVNSGRHLDRRSYRVAMFRAGTSTYQDLAEQVQAEAEIKTRMERQIGTGQLLLCQMTKAYISELVSWLWSPRRGARRAAAASRSR